MKIAVASDDGKNIAGHFGRSRGFIIYNIDRTGVRRKEYRANTFTPFRRGAADAALDSDCHMPIFLGLADCSVVIVRGMQKRLYDDLRGARMKVILTSDREVEDAIGKYLKGRLRNEHRFTCRRLLYRGKKSRTKRRPAGGRKRSTDA